MKLSDFFDKENIVRDGEFLRTMYSKALEPYSICYASKELYLSSALSNPNISAIIVTKDLSSLVDETRGVVVAEDPQLAYYELHNYLTKNNLIPLLAEHVIHATARIAPTVIIELPVNISENVVIQHYTFIGSNTVIGPGVYIGEHVAIGVKGMQRTRVNDENYTVLFAGGVRIGKGCEILSNSIIQKPYQATFTEIGDDCQIGGQVTVGHGGRIGRRTMIAGNAQISGNVMIGEDVWIGPSASIVDGITIGDKAQIKIGSVVVENVKPNEEVSGNFAIPHKKQLRLYARVKNDRL